MECENPQRQEQGSQAVGIPWGNALNSSAVTAYLCGNAWFTI